MSVTTKKALPQANGDFYAISSTLSEEDQALLRRTRDFLEADVVPIITEYWIREEFPHQIIPKLAELDIMGLPYQGYGCPGKR
jgi:glutaryl-CoA dehydrogenase